MTMTSSIINDDILDSEQTAELLRCDKSTVEALARSGDLPATKYGRSWVFVRSLVIEAVKARTLGVVPSEPAVTSVWPLKAERNRSRGRSRNNISVGDLPPLPGH